MIDEPVQGRCNDCLKYEPGPNDRGHCDHTKRLSYRWWTGCEWWEMKLITLGTK